MSTAYFSLASGNFSQNWSDIGLILTNNNWANVPSIKGFQGTLMASSSGVDPQTLTTVNSGNTADSVIANQTNPNTTTTGGIAEFELANPTVALQGSGTARAPYLVLYMDGTGRENIQLTFNARDIDGSGDNSIQQIAVQYRIGETGDWINLPSGYIADASSGPSLATLVTAVSVTLPAAANGQSQIQIRIMTADAVGSDEWIGIDDIAVTSQAPSTATLAINDVTLSEGNSGTTDFTFTVTRSGVTTGTASATWTLANGTTDSADFTATPQTGTVSFADGETSRTVTVSVAGDTSFESNETFLVNLTNAVGATISDAQGQGTITNDDTAPSSTLSINDVTMTEGNSGVTNMVFTVTRTGSTSGAVGVDWVIDFGANSASHQDMSTAALSGTISFADGQSTATITVPIDGDTTVEPNETFIVGLTNPTGGATISDATGTGTITNDDVPSIANIWINEINYDPAGTDTNEFVELAGLAGVDLTGYSLVLYNGNGGAVYSTISLSGALTDSTDGFGFVKVLTPGIQNGPPDGIALVDNLNRVIQFLSYEGTMTAVGGPAAGMTSTDIGVEQANAALGFTMQLTGTGSSYGDFEWSADVANTEGAANDGQSFLSGTVPGQISIADARVTEGNSGEALMVFTVQRAGGYASAASVPWEILLNGTATTNDFGPSAVPSGTITFAANEFSKTIVVPIAGDVTGEFNETFTVSLGTPTGNAVIADGTATGTIVNDDPLTLTIMQLQGAGQRSEYVGQPVTTTGIVTAVDAGGFFMQDPTGDGNASTSDAVFVYLGAAPAVVVGDAVTVSASVAENASATGLSVTELHTPTITVTSHDNPLPAALVIGPSGLLPPNTTIDDDGLTVFDPVSDGIDFWESLEGMRVTIENPLVVQNTNSYGETDVVAGLGVGATGVNDRGGITVSAGDFNPEKIQLDDRFGALIGYNPAHTFGDKLNSVTGILNYSFGNYEVLVTEAVTVSEDVSITEEQSKLVADANNVSIATYNLENMDPSDNKYSILGHDIVYNLRAPDIIAVQEVQDADGAGTGTNLSGVSNAQGLIDAIFAESGIVYTYVEIAPASTNTSGGEPNGNIRPGYFYRADRVSLVTGSLAQITGTPFDGSRKPLVATWDFQGQQFTTINVHFTSRGGSDLLWGATQPPADAGDAARTAQAAAVGAYVNDQLATNPALNFMVLGDWNGFYFEQAQTQLTGAGGVFTNLAVHLLPPEERYSYLFEGNSQLIDNMLVTGGLLTGASYDGVHLNAHYPAAGRPTDHDPQLALLLLGTKPHDIVISNDAVNENLPGGAAVGTVSATDAAGDTLTYSLVDDAGGRFQIDADTGAVTTTAALDFEAAQYHDIVVRVTDSANQSSDATMRINVGNVLEAPTAGNDNLIYTSAAESIAASAGSDTIDGGGGNDTIDGGSGDDSLLGGDGNDFIAGKAGEDTLNGGAGNDVLYLGMDGSNDVAVGGSGNDTVDWRESNAGIAVTLTSPGTGTATSGAETDSFSGIEAFMLTAYADAFTGSAANDTVTGLGGNDSLAGGDGSDTFIVGNGDGIDTIDGGAGTEDRILARTPGTWITMQSVSNVEIFDGNGMANFRLIGTSSADLIDLSGATLIGVDRVDGGAGNDTIIGSAGNDVLADSAGQDSLSGGLGDDIFLISATTGAGDVIDGGAGSDTIKLMSNVYLTGATIRNVEAINTNGFILDVRDTAAADRIDMSGIAVSTGYAVTASGGNDTIIGSSGVETIMGGAGADLMTGGGGNDVFRYNSLSQSTTAAPDHITDFAAGDKIMLTGIDANSILSGVQSFTFIGSAAFTPATPGQLRAYVDGSGNTVIEANINNDTVADFRLVLDAYSTPMTGADFIL